MTTMVKRTAIQRREGDVVEMAQSLPTWGSDAPLLRRKAMPTWSPNRRELLRTAGIGAAALAAPRVLWAAPDPRRRPNIVLILADDMGFSDIGCYGSEIPTPNLDRLAAGGVRFTQFYNTARCCPSRASLLTGAYPHQAAVGHMMEDKQLEGYQGDLSRRYATIAEALRPAGYGTYMAGKWHVTRFVGPDGPKHNWPIHRGFERYYGIIAGAANYFDPASLTRDDTRITAADDPEYHPAEYYLTDAISDQAARYITEHHKQRPDDPFFLYVAFTAAHWPLHAPQAAIARQRGRYDGGYEPTRRRRFERERELGLIHREWELSPQAGDWAGVADKAFESRCMEVYAAQVERMDQGVGRIVAALQQAGRLDNTLIFFLQDNGGCAEEIRRAPGPDGKHPMPGAKDTWVSYGQSWANVSNTPFRYYKHFVHEGGISTPLIAHWPAGIRRRGELEHQPGHLIDIMATCLDVSGAEYPKELNGNPILPIEGRSLTPAFAGRAIEREAIYWEHEGNRAIRAGQWKLVARAPAGAWELYDMEKDRTELHDLAEQQPERVKAMAAQWEAWARRAHVLPWPWRPAYGQAAVAAKKLFELKMGDDLPGEDAPQVGGRPFTITASVSNATGGIIVAHGGTRLGYALYVDGGRLAFVLRRNGVMTTVVAPDKLPAGEVEVGASVARGGAIALTVAGRKVAAGKAAGLLPDTPVEGLQVGQDGGAAVGDYAVPNKLAGTVKSVRITLGG